MKITGFILSMAFLLLADSAFSQGKFYTKTGKVSFFSSTSMENIEAHNNNGLALWDSQSGELQFAVLLKGFEFKKALMQEHFNSDYVESDKFPRSEFKGKILNNGEIKYASNGTYAVKLKGQLTLHGVTRDLETTGSVTIKDGKLQTSSIFNIILEDYNIKLSKSSQDNISKTIKITVEGTLEPLKQ